MSVNACLSAALEFCKGAMPRHSAYVGLRTACGKLLSTVAGGKVPLRFHIVVFILNPFPGQSAGKAPSKC
jgi:hypothetical protein